MKTMDQYDLPVLTRAGFESGWSGSSWFGRDRNGNEWQAYLDDKSTIVFRSKTKDKWGPSGPLQYADFVKLFLKEE